MATAAGHSAGGNGSSGFGRFATRAPLWLAIIAISIGAPVVSLCLWRWWATVERLRAAARD